MTKHSRIISVTFIIALVTGCSNAPRTVDASIPLVEDNSIISNEPIPPRFWSTLNNTMTNQFPYQDYTILMSSIYDSALGAKCRTLTFMLNSTVSDSRIGCSMHQQSQWFLTKSISQEYAKVVLK